MRLRALALEGRTGSSSKFVAADRAPCPNGPPRSAGIYQKISADDNRRSPDWNKLLPRAGYGDPMECLLLRPAIDTCKLIKREPSPQSGAGFQRTVALTFWRANRLDLTCAGRRRRGRTSRSQEDSKCRARGQLALLRCRDPATRRSLGQTCRALQQCIYREGQ